MDKINILKDGLVLVTYPYLAAVTGQMLRGSFSLVQMWFLCETWFYGLESEAVKVMAFIIDVVLWIQMDKRLSCKKTCLLKSRNKFGFFLSV